MIVWGGVPTSRGPADDVGDGASSEGETCCCDLSFGPSDPAFSRAMIVWSEGLTSRGPADDAGDGGSSEGETCCCNLSFGSSDPTSSRAMIVIRPGTLITLSKATGVRGSGRDERQADA